MRDGGLHRVLWELVRLSRRLHLGSPSGWPPHHAVKDALAALERVREMVAVYEREYAVLPAEEEQS